MGSPAASTVVLREHAYYCFDVIAAKLNGRKLRTAEFDESAEYPLFVTWNVQSKSSGGYSLRGCIGNFEASPIGKGLRDYAAISAFKDTRFSPISIRELDKLSCGVSLLTDFELCDSYLDWTLATHGVYIQFPSIPPTTPSPHSSASPPPTTSSSSSSSAATSSRASSSPVPNGKVSYRSLSSLPPFVIQTTNGHAKAKILSATFLPDVPPEQGWSKVTTIDSAIKKAGYRGQITEAVRESCRVVRYQSRKVSVDWSEWSDLRAEN